MYDNDVEFSEIPVNDNRGLKRDLRKLNSAGSTDSEDISEASSSTSCDQSALRSSNSTRQILITNMDPIVFTDQNVMNIFEAMLRKYDSTVKVLYFKSFSRARADFPTVSAAVSAKDNLNGLVFGSKPLKCFFFRDLLLGRRNSDHLELPPLEKQFLISPPVSPPVGWEPVQEGEPIMDYELLAALASLQPGESHELHPGIQDKNIPAIFLQPCETDEGLPSSILNSPDDSDEEMLTRAAKGFKPHILQDRRPPQL